MGNELTSAADFAHLDGALVFPLFIDEYHVLVVEDGSILALPGGMHVHFAGRIGIGPEGIPHVDTRVSPKDTSRLARWGAALSEKDEIDGIRASLAEMLEQYPNPERYINQPPCVATGEKEI